jgi:RHS repeat-associated protein
MSTPSLGIEPTRRRRGLYNQHFRVGMLESLYQIAWTSRWLSPDPIGFRGGTNLQAYVANNPIGRIDPDGLAWTHTTGKTIGCGGGCTIRIDTTVIDGRVTRHLHWECSRGSRQGEMGEFGTGSHGQDWTSAPQSIIDCAERNGFQPKPQTQPRPPQRTINASCGPACKSTVVLGAFAIFVYVWLCGGTDTM